MHVYHLPHDILGINPEARPESIVFHEYTARMGSFKDKSVLHTNAISMVISGEKTMHFADRKVEITPDEFHFLSAGNCLASMDLSKQEYFESILIFFDDSALHTFLAKYAELTDRMNIDRQLTSRPYLSIRKDEFVVTYIRSLQLLFRQSGRISPEMKQLKFEELMLHLLQTCPQELLSFRGARPGDADEIRLRKTVEMNVGNDIKIEELAFLCNMSLSTFSRRFAKIYGQSPSKWFWQRRMEMAKNLLLHHHEKPGEVYHKVGYENHSSFSEAFRQTFGLSPREFQQQNMTVEP